jgi:hypothetical protein
VTAGFAPHRWAQSHRIVRSIYPPIALFEDIADPADWELLVAAEAKLNPRLRDVVGNLALVPAARRVSGPTASLVMGAFTHCSPDRPSRFSDGRFGVWYCGDRFEVALAETAHHFERFMRATVEPPGEADVWERIAAVGGRLAEATDPALLAPEDWAPAQDFARRMREAGADGILYRSVRWPAGQAMALFWPDTVTLPVRDGRQLRYHWDGHRMDRWFVHGTRAWRAWP